MKMRFATNFGRKTKAFIGLIVLFFSIFLLPIQSYAALEEIKNGTDISTLDIRKFNLNINNVSVLSKSQSVDQFHLSNPHYEYLSGGAYPGEMENFTLKVDKSKKQDQVFENPLSLKFTNIGTVNGKQVDAYLNFNKVTLHYLNTAQAESEMNSPQKSTVEFFSISELWESNAFEIGNVPYVDANHDYIMNKAFWIDADVTAEIRYADGTETDLKLVMKPTDIDAIDANNLKETFYVKNYQNDVNLRLMNNANVLVQEEASDRTSWIATQITGGSYYENNVSGLALRSNSNSMNFGYSSTETCSAVFGLYIEKIDPRPVLDVDPAEIPAKEGQDVTYKATFKVPVPGKDILAAPSSIEMVQKFDERLDYKELKAESGGVTLQEGRDYTIEKTGQTVTVKMTPEYLKGNSSTDIIITYKTATNKKVEEKGSEKIDNTVTLHVDNLSAPSNQVSTALLYEKHHEFVSGTPGKELPQEVKALLPATEKNLSNGSQVTPTQPSKTEVKTAEGTWSFKSYDKTSETINGADVKFVGTWEFTPAPTYKATHEFVSGTPGKELPQEVKALLPVDQTDLKDGSQATPTQPSKTEVKTTEGTWSFKSYDKTSETINGADAHFVGTWEFTPASTYKATHEFVSGTPGKELPQEVKDLLPADQTDLKDGSQATPTQPSKTEVKTTEGTWSFKSYDKPSETINGADAHFVGTWEFTPAPTYKATHEFVSGTPGKELPQEVKDLLPVAQTDLKDGSQATPTQPSKTEVKTTEGTWSFKSYDKPSETINGADAHFVGTWEFTPAPTYKATHEFVSGTPGKELPQEVKDLLPADQTDLKDGSQATPTQPSKTEVKTTEGTWSFKSYDKPSETINGADAHFVGTWEFTPVPTYKATHEFVSGTPGKELPQEVKDLLPADQTDLKDGSQATPTQPSKTEVKTTEGTWSFKSYDKTSETINGADAHFVGTWEFTPASTYKATHEFVSGTPGKELPQEVKDLLPVAQTDLKDGSQATPTQPSKTEVKTTEGTWSFKSYDKPSETINGADVKFVGTWEFTPAPTYKATHEFVSGTPGKELPQEVKALLPADQTDLKDGSQATPTQPSQTEVKTTEGTWSFKSYDKTSETVNGSDVKFVGTWEFTASPAPTVTHKAVHEFVSGTPGKELPQEVKSLLPADQTDLKDGSQATPTQPSKTEVKTSEGTWNFKSYDKTSETINGSDVKFVGTWEFTPAPTYKATHEFVSGTPGKELPQEVKSLLPADQTDLKDGSQVTPTEPSQTEVKTTEGTWSFKSYDKTSETINGSDVKFVGTWEFTASPVPTYKATHEFVSGTPGKELPQEVKALLPADQTDLKDGSQATPTQPSQTEVKTTEGTWSFKSYDKTSETINGSDVKFVGTWEFTASPAPTVTHKAVHEFVSGTPGKELPQEVKALLPADITDLKDGSQVTPTQPSQTEVKTTEGTWNFKSYDKTSETVNGSDVKFVGTWEFTASPAPTVTHKAVHEFVSGTPGKELPQEVKALLPADQTDLKDGSQVTPTQPSQTEVKTAEGTWSFKSYDKTLETINGADAHFVGTWEFTPALTPHKGSGNNTKSEEATTKNKNVLPGTGESSVKNKNVLPSIGESSTKNKNLLPNTGETSTVLLSMIGFAFAGLVGYVVRKKGKA
ncbi:LPXTG-anchored SHIRT domain periscope protein [Streptococcus gordonii]|uniref:LPXTG-anchored SHIRT domain periscope protein n=1 Tax=Streptococcus gordonii TaxID=1302 RepID=UPI001CBD268F|nr:LPXTG-anchored SHIRT domain periscope protein [Streptococcus gordonii]MBZ2135844.1 LPXTG-anchored SHIRT domain periscope protein [Streptococcus gordonii]